MSLILLGMGTNMNFTGFGTDLPVESRPPGNFSLVRQPSVYSLTFDEFQSSLGKDFGSMNMEELLKSIWSAEETQNVASAPAASTADGGNQGGYLQRQGSLTLPRTLSLKTVDEVWRDIAKDYANGKDSAAAASMPQTQRQPTLGEITLEEFLVRAGVVREDNQPLSQPNNNMSFGINFQQPNRSGGLTGSRIAEKGAEISLQQRVFPLNVNGVGSTQHQPIATYILQQQHPKHQQQQPIFPRRSTVSCAPSVAIPSSNQLSSPEIRGGIVGLVTPKINGNLANGSALQGGGGIGTVGFGAAGRGNGTNSPTFSSDGLKSSEDTSSVSPVPYMFNGGLRGRKSKNTVDKAIERRHRRMIKNRESAARSRARKQAYTMELEQEVAKLKEENEELRKKQAEIIEMQKNQVLEKMDAQYGNKKRRLMRTLTGPW